MANRNNAVEKSCVEVLSGIKKHFFNTKVNIDALVKRSAPAGISNKQLSSLDKAIRVFTELLESSSFNKDYESMQITFGQIVSNFSNLCASSHAGHSPDECKSIKEDLAVLRKKIQSAKSGKVYPVKEVVPYDWHESTECNKKITDFHQAKAMIPSGVPTKDFDKRISMLRKFLEKKGLCKRIVHSGSVYEKVNICGDILEFDTMFVADGNWLSIQKIADPGFSYLKPEDDMHDLHDYLDSRGNLDPTRYCHYFKSVVQRWLNIYKDDSMKLHEHGVAILINVFEKPSKLWYQIDLVPCYEKDSILYVPKSHKNEVKAWRRSYSEQERDLLKKGGTVSVPTQPLKRRCVRIVKAIFKLQTSLFKSTYTSYLIKTTMFHFQKDKGVKWSEEKFGKCLLLFLKKIRDCLETKKLMHYFEPKINLLVDLQDSLQQQMVGCIDNWLKKEAKFYELIEV